VAERSRHPAVEAMRRAHYQWLLDTNQEEKAGAVKEAEGDDFSAITLYLRGGLPARAAQVHITIRSVTCLSATLLGIWALFCAWTLLRSGGRFSCCWTDKQPQISYGLQM
jgi:hypothetical protein